MSKSIKPVLATVIIIVVIAIVVLVGWQITNKKGGGKSSSMTPDEVKAKMKAGGMDQPKVPEKETAGTPAPMGGPATAPPGAGGGHPGPLRPTDAR